MKRITITEQSDNNSFTLYDNNLGSILREFEGFEFADVKYSIDDVAGPYGSTYITSKFGRRRLSLKGDLVGNNIFENRRLLFKALRQTGLMKLFTFTTYDDLNLQFEGEVVRMINPYTHKIHEYLIEIIAPDWRFYSQTLKSFDMSQTVIQGGAAIPAIIPMSIPLNTDPETQVNNIVTNEGSEITDPIFTITGPGTGFTIRNETLDKEIVLSTVLADNTEQIIIDVKNRTVETEIGGNIYPDLTGEFWSLIPGENELRFFVGTGLTPDTNLNISYRDAYGGI